MSNNYKITVGDHQLTVLKMPPDGNCIFHAILYHLNEFFSTTTEALQKVAVLRKIIAKHLQDNKTTYHNLLYSNAIDEFGNISDAENLISLYLDRIKTLGTWGGDDILISSAKIFKRKVIIYQLNAPILTRDPNSPTMKRPIELFYHNNHYDVVVNKIPIVSIQ
jgi:hypothetical protein